MDKFLPDNESVWYLENREKSVGYRVEIRCRTALREIEVASEKLHSQQGKYKNKQKQQKEKRKNGWYGVC